MLRGSYIKRFILSSVFMIFVSISICAPAICEEAIDFSHTEATSTYTESLGESGEEGSHEGDRSADLLDLLYRFILFTVMVIVLVVFFRKARVMEYLSVRTEEIRKRLDELKREKEEAVKKYRDMEGRVRDFELKRVEILEEYRKEGIAERDRIINEAKERAKHIIAQSEIAIDQEIRSSKNMLKQDIAEMVIGQAREIIRKEINEKDNNDLINEFIERVRKIN